MTRETVAAAALQIGVHTTTADSNTCLSREATTTTTATAKTPAIIAPPLAVRTKRENRFRGHLSKLNSTTVTTKTTTNCYNTYERDTARATTLLKTITTTSRRGDFIVLH